MASPHAYHSLNIGLATDVGRVRTENQDSMGKFPEEEQRLDGDREQLFIVADGMGGHADGRKASDTAVRVVRDVYYNRTGSVLSRLKEALKEANRVIHEMVKGLPHGETMGTTCTVLVLSGTRAFVGHIGDSRMYRFNRQESLQVTRDHTMVSEMVEQGVLTAAEAVHHPHRNMLSRALGPEANIKPETFEADRLRTHDVFVLCSDGLSEVSIEEIREVVKDLGPQAASQALVKMALDRGGLDNVTVQVIQIDPPGAPATPAPSRVMGDQTVPQSAYTPDASRPPTPPKPESLPVDSLSFADPHSTGDTQIPEPAAPPKNTLHEYGYTLGDPDDEDPDPFQLQKSAGEQSDESDTEENGKAKKRKWWPPFAVLALIGTAAGIWYLAPFSTPSPQNDIVLTNEENAAQSDLAGYSEVSTPESTQDPVTVQNESPRSESTPQVTESTSARNSNPRPAATASSSSRVSEPLPSVAQTERVTVPDQTSPQAADPVTNQLNLARAAMATKDRDGAIREYKKVLTLDSDNRAARSGLREIYDFFLHRGDVARRSDKQAALAAYEKAQTAVSTEQIAKRIADLKKLM